MQIGPSESKALLAKQLAEHYSNIDSKTWTKPAQDALVEFSELDKEEVREVLDEVQRLVGKDTYQDVFLPKLFEVGTAIGLFAQAQNAQSGKGAARPEDAVVPAGSLRGVDLRAAEQMTRAKALVTDKDVLGKAVKDLDQQIKQMKADLAASDIPESMKQQFGASIDKLSVDKLEDQVDKFGLALQSVYKRADRMRMAGQRVQADMAIEAFHRDAKRSMQKMASECRDVERGNSILRLISSGNMSIEALLMAVMLMFFEDNAEQLREKLAQMAHKKAQVADLKAHQKAIETAEDTESAEIALGDFDDYLAMTSMQETVEDTKEDIAPTPGTEKGEEADEAKEEAKAARSGEASGSEVAKEREASGTEAETASADATDESVDEGAQLSLTSPPPTPAVTPAPKKKDPVQLSLFKAGTLDPKGTQLQLAFDEAENKPSKPTTTTTTTTTSTTTSTTSSTSTTTTTGTEKPVEKPKEVEVAPAAAAKLDAASVARIAAAKAKIDELVGKLETDMQKIELEVKEFQEKCSASIQLATQIFQSITQMLQAARNKM